jgi:hypothetical protein
MQFVARIGGKTVSYPKSATFVIQQKKRGEPMKIIASRDNLDTAIGKYHRCQKPGTTTLLCPVMNGRFLPAIAKG